MKKIIATICGIFAGALAIWLFIVDYRMKHRRYIKIPSVKDDT